MKRHSFIKIASVLMAFLMALSIVPTFSAEVNNPEPAEVAENIVTYATIDEFLCEVKNKEITITGYIGNAEKLTIPSKLGDYTVTEIADNAFKGNATLKSLIVRYGILRIGESAFEDCTALSSIDFQGFSSVGRNAIKNTAFYNKESNWKNGLLIVSGIYVLDAKEDLSDVVRVPYSIYVIGDGAFSDCKNIEGIYLYDDLFYIIGDYAFENCENLKGVKIPTTLKTMGRDIFKGCKNVTVYAVEETDLIKELCKSESIPLDIIGKYSAYNEEWDITMYAYDDIGFTIEEVTYTEEELKNIEDSIKGINIVGKQYKVNFHDTIANNNVTYYANATLKVPLMGETIVEICTNTNVDSDYPYKAYPYYFSENKDGYVEFSCYSDDIIANVNFDYYSTTDETQTLSLSLPVSIEIDSLFHFMRNEENDKDFAYDIDRNIPQGKSFSYVRINTESPDYLPFIPTNIGIKVKVPTKYEENVAYVFKPYSFIPIECETKDGFAEFTYPFDSIYYLGCVVAGIEEPVVSTESTKATEATEPSESTAFSEPATSATVATDPAETTKPAESVATEPIEDSTSATADTQSTDATEATSPQETTSSQPTGSAESTTATEDEITTSADNDTATTPNESEDTSASKIPTDSSTIDEENYLLGDVNRDGKVNIKDVTLIQKYLAKIETFDDEQMVIADFDQNKKVNIKDATAIQKKIANII